VWGPLEKLGLNSFHKKLEFFSAFDCNKFNQCLKFVRGGGVLESPSELPLEGGEWGCAVSVAPAASGLGVNLTLQQLQLDAALGDFLTLNAGRFYNLNF